jgi:hypothetical protein
MVFEQVFGKLPPSDELRHESFLLLQKLISSVTGQLHTPEGPSRDRGPLDLLEESNSVQDPAWIGQLCSMSDATPRALTVARNCDRLHRPLRRRVGGTAATRNPKPSKPERRWCAKAKPKTEEFAVLRRLFLAMTCKSGLLPSSHLHCRCLSSLAKLSTFNSL